MRSQLILFASAALVSAGDVWGEKCKKAGVDFQPKNIDLNQYAGTWYEIQRDVSAWYEFTATCVTGKYAISNWDSNVYDAKFRGFYWMMWWGYQNMDGWLKFSSADRSFKLGTSKESWFESSQYVLDVDYSSHSIVYKCTDTWFGKTEGLHVWSRENKPSDEKFEALRALIKEQPVLAHYNFQRDAVKTDHTNCIYN